MKVSGLAAVIAASVLLACGCSSEGGDSDADQPAATPSSPSSTTAVGTPIDGDWEATFVEHDYVAYLVELGVEPRAAREVWDKEFGAGAVVLMTFRDGYFNIADKASGSSWQNGSYRVDGSLLTIDEPCCGESSVEFALKDEDELVFDPVPYTGEVPDPPPEYVPGVPVWFVGEALWCSMPWTRVT